MLERKPKMKNKTIKIKRNNPLQKTKKKVMKKMIMEKKRKMRVKKKTN
jgi:hypothetical protein